MVLLNARVDEHQQPNNIMSIQKKH
ncbi:Protein of unknown function [Bacillus cereus]|nr:Protein of unknown function [Bacillus cereus]